MCNEKRIILFTANYTGGILQFTLEMMAQLIKQGCYVICFVPKGVKISSQLLSNFNFVFYDKKNTLFNLKKHISVIENIMSYKPDYVWITDHSIVPLQIGKMIGDKLPTMITVHDPICHSTNQKSVSYIIKSTFEKIYLSLAAKKASKILLLSKFSKEIFLIKHKKYEKKIFQINLGAHIITEKKTKPIELSNYNQSFILFFGRIDKYKGIGHFLKGFLEIEDEIESKFIIAGNGNLSGEEKELIYRSKKTIVINRYILDEEMLYLFNNCSCVVLPYTDATQSGVIPIAYKLGKPVIVSNILGLTQFVDNKKTGYVCDNDSDYGEAVKYVLKNASNMGESALNYYKEYLDFEKNIRLVLGEMFPEKEEVHS